MNKSVAATHFTNKFSSMKRGSAVQEEFRYIQKHSANTNATTETTKTPEKPGSNPGDDKSGLYVYQQVPTTPAGKKSKKGGTKLGVSWRSSESSPSSSIAKTKSLTLRPFLSSSPSGKSEKMDMQRQYR